MSLLESAVADSGADAGLDAAAMARSREGDWEAFGGLVERHRGALVRYLSRLVGDRERGEELAQEAFVRLWLASRRYREEGRFEAYLYSIGTRLAKSAERRRRVRRRALLSGQLGRFGWLGNRPGREPYVEAEASARLLQEEVEAKLAHAVAELPVAFRAPLVLAALEDRPVEEIARLLGLRAATVKSRLFRARERLREQLQPYWKGVSS